MVLTAAEKKKIMEKKAFESKLEGTTKIMGVDFNNAELAVMQSDNNEKLKAERIAEIRAELDDIKKEYEAEPEAINPEMLRAFKLEDSGLEETLANSRISRKEELKNRINELEQEVTEVIPE